MLIAELIGRLRDWDKAAIDRLGLFGYRTGVLESEVIKPLF